MIASADGRKCSVLLDARKFEKGEKNHFGLLAFESLVHLIIESLKMNK